MIVGLTGGIGSGKTTVANLFLEFENVFVYFADDEAKKLMNTSLVIKDKIKKAFGEESYTKEGLNRKHIAGIVFSDAKKIQTLNKIVHPEVKNHFQEFVKEYSHKDYILYENAILFESKSNFFCDFIISVFVPKSVRIDRIMKRDHCSKLEAENRIHNQWLEDKKILQANYLIENIDLNYTKIQVKRIHNILTKNKRFI